MSSQKSQYHITITKHNKMPSSFTVKIYSTYKYFLFSTAFFFNLMISFFYELLEKEKVQQKRTLI